MQTWETFGKEVQEARLSRRYSQRRLAKAAHCSHMTINRIEHGTPAGDQALIRKLDELLSAGGALTDMYGRLTFPQWQSREAALIELPENRARGFWQHTFPAEYSGKVWIAVRPASANRQEVHILQLNWGPWRRYLQFSDFAAGGQLLVTGKSAENIAVPLRATIDPPAHLLFGTQDETTDLARATLIHQGWLDTEDMEAQRYAGQRLISAFRRASTDPTQSDAIRDTMRRCADLLQSLNEPLLQSIIGTALERKPRR